MTTPADAAPPQEGDALREAETAMQAALTDALAGWPEGSVGRIQVMRLWQATLEYSRASLGATPPAGPEGTSGKIDFALCRRIGRAARDAAGRFTDLIAGTSGPPPSAVDEYVGLSVLQASRLPPAGPEGTSEDVRAAAKRWTRRLHQMKPNGISVSSHPPITTMPNALFDELRDWLASLWVRPAARGEPDETLREAAFVAMAVWESQSLTGTSEEYERGWSDACRIIVRDLNARALSVGCGHWGPLLSNPAVSLNEIAAEAADAWFRLPQGSRTRAALRARFMVFAADLRAAASPAVSGARSAPAGESGDGADAQRLRYIAEHPEIMRYLYDLFGEAWVNDQTGKVRRGMLKEGADPLAAIRDTIDDAIKDDRAPAPAPSAAPPEGQNA